ncbi:hypothetical protein NHX12_019971 [Muraenolepis orangiensis]|uniref:Uncharacterized protein n=1 Tax=Muraenolepis orangiensis TaxID=630683 RepID=A0A9Q0EUJ7_9TELE|nr:hypothetical protein NHX12_019971 [Muraenolepis orangiensis]
MERQPRAARCSRRALRRRRRDMMHVQVCLVLAVLGLTWGACALTGAIHQFPTDVFSNSQRRQGALLLHVAAAMYTFLALAIVCDDYFVVSLEKICVFVTHGDVGVGTIVGSAVFNILCIVGVCSLLAGSPVETSKWLISWPISLVLFLTIPDVSQPRWEKYYLVAFFGSTLWIAIFSYVMVWMVTVIGFTLGIPDVIMGITFLAAGTSVPDCMASLLVARQGFQQANVVILPRFLADDFQVFCSLNPAALPLLYRSGPGETACPPLASSADIRDAPRQPGAADSGVVRSGEQGICWSDMVCFYLGCSFGFEGQLRDAGVPVRNVEHGTNFSMYRTTVPCVPAGVFHGPLVVTMRPVPADMLTTAAHITHLNPQAHGAPVHIGDPEAPLAFSHSPGSMFLTDVPDSLLPASQLSPLCLLVCQDPLLYSLASQRAVGTIRQLERVIGEDPGNRGIRALFVEDELVHSCLALSHSTSVAITTGFPTHFMHSPPDETDGPPGALAMATMLLALGKQVTMVTDRRALQMNQDLVEEAVRTDSGPDSALHFLCHEGDPRKPRFDHLVAIERSGRAADGNYYNMRGVNIKHLVDPVDDLFVAAMDLPGITTIGVSNWGGYAVACGLYLLSTCPSHQRYLRRGTQPATSPVQLDHLVACLPSVDKEEALLSTLVRLGVRSGKTGNLAMEVDGLTFHPTHSDLISRLLALTLDSAPTSMP